MNKQPKISVVTVSFNCRDVIEQTICNVLHQTYGNVEYIVIDGASTDGTKEIIDRYADRLAYYVSEPDKGIYEAMNKGILAATGEWIIFRNAGDYFFKPTTIADVFSWYEDHGEELIVGGLRSFKHDSYRDGVYTGGADVWQRALIPHASTFVRLSAHKAHLFPTEYRIASDYHFFQQMMLEGADMAIYDGIVALFDAEYGISSRNLLQNWREMLQIRKSLGAPAEVIKETKRKCRRLRMASLILDVLKKNRRLYAAYRRVHPKAGWTMQPIDVTLSDI